MRLASLEMWPDQPYLENEYVPWPKLGEINAVGRFVLGLRHDWDHLGQIEDIVRQAKAARSLAWRNRNRSDAWSLCFL